MRHVAELEILDLNTLRNRATNRIGSYMNTEFSNLDLVYQFWGEVTLRLDEQFPLILNVRDTENFLRHLRKVATGVSILACSISCSM